MKTAIISAFILFFGFNLYSQETKTVYRVETSKEFEWHENRIGFTYSMMSGYGLTYLREFNDKVALKSQLFAYGSIDDEEAYSDNYINFSIGTELQYTLKRFDRTRLYLLAGYYYEYGLEKYNYGWSGEQTELNEESSNNIGIGFGFEFLAFSNLSFSLDGGYHGRFAKEIDKYEDTNVIINESSPIRFGFAMGISAFYNF